MKRLPLQIRAWRLLGQLLRPLMKLDLLAMTKPSQWCARNGGHEWVDVDDPVLGISMPVHILIRLPAPS